MQIGRVLSRKKVYVVSPVRFSTDCAVTLFRNIDLYLGLN